jgi:hypothetical protein
MRACKQAHVRIDGRRLICARRAYAEYALVSMLVLVLVLALLMLVLVLLLLLVPFVRACAGRRHAACVMCHARRYAPARGQQYTGAQGGESTGPSARLRPRSFSRFCAIDDVHVHGCGACFRVHPAQARMNGTSSNCSTSTSIRSTSASASTSILTSAYAATALCARISLRLSMRRDAYMNTCVHAHPATRKHAYITSAHTRIHAYTHHAYKHAYAHTCICACAHM